MGGKKWMAAVLAGLISFFLTTPANSQSIADRGPTRDFSVPQARVLGAGTGILSTSVFLVPQIGPLSSNAINLRAALGLENNFQLDTGISTGVAGWGGQLDLTGKWGLLQERQGALFSLSTMAGGVLSTDVNGNPVLGIQLGVPISKGFAFNDVNILGLTVFPAYNIGIFAPGRGSVTPANFASLGLGANLAISPNLHVLADSNLGLTGVGGVLTQSNLGLRFAFSPVFMTDVFFGFNQSDNLGLRRIPASIGLSAHLVF